MKLSHSQLSCILTCPMTYYLKYVMGIDTKTPKAAFDIGSAVHWGIEHDTEDISSQLSALATIDDKIMSSCMVHGYRYHKNKILNNILLDDETDTNTILSETHEVYINGKLKSFIFDEPHIFVGIIDLLLLTEKGFIIIDYKTSSQVPDWNSYLDQLYRYIFLLRSEFPDVPIYKIGIINIRKTKVKRLKGENDESYKNRLMKEYEVNDNNLINWHIFSEDSLNMTIVNEYIENLSRMADAAEMIDINKLWYINYSKINDYGGSPYKDIFNHTPYAYVLYNIRDRIYDEKTQSFVNIRDCKDIDMQVLDNSNVLNKYEQFKAQAVALYTVNNNIDKNALFKHLSSNFITDNELLELYWNTLSHEIEKDSKVNKKDN